MRNPAQIVRNVINSIRGGVGTTELAIELGDSPSDCQRKLKNGRLVHQAADPLQRYHLQRQLVLARTKAETAVDAPAWLRLAETIEKGLAVTRNLALRRGWKEAGGEEFNTGDDGALDRCRPSLHASTVGIMRSRDGG